MKQSLPSLIAATICGLAWALGPASGDGIEPGGFREPSGPAPDRSGFQVAVPASTAPSLLGVPALDVPARNRPYPPSRFSSESGSSPMFGSYGIVPAGHAEEPEGPPPPPPAPPPAATVIAGSIRSLSSRRSISAKTRQGAKLFGRELVGSGTFAQGPLSSRLVRYDLQLLVKNRAVSRLQVSDGQYLWIVDDQTGVAEIERIEVDRLVTAAAAEAGAAVEGAGGAEAAAFAAPRELALGGVARLMTSLEKSFEFSGVVRSQLGNVPVYVVEGRWKPAVLAKALPDQFVKVSQGQGTYDTSALRGHVPNQVVVYIGVDDQFPYRIEYRRTSGAGGAVAASGSSTGTGSGAGAPTGGDSAPYEVPAYIDFFEVRFDVLLDGSLFTFAPGARPYIDVTESYLAKQKK